MLVVDVMCCASYGMLISVQYEGSWAGAVNGRMRTHLLSSFRGVDYLAPLPEGGGRHLLHD